MTLKRRKDLERKAPRVLRRGPDKIRIYEDSATGQTMLLVGAKFRTEAELLEMACAGWSAKQAAGLAAMPVGGNA